MIGVISSSLGRHVILSLDLELQLRGVWTATVETGDPAPTGAVTLELAAEDGSVDTFSGVVRPGSGEHAGRSRLWVVGGAGGLASELVARDYTAPRGVGADLVVGRLLADLGEQLDPTVELSGLVVERWHRGGLTGKQALSLFAERLGLDWRVLASGAVWLGVDSWPAADTLAGFVERVDHDARVIYARPDSARLRPGVTVLGERIHRVRYLLGEGGLRAELGYGQTDREEFRAALEAVLPPRVYREVHAATVIAQQADGTLDLQADDARIGGLSRVPLEVGAPGMRVTVAQGARVRVAFHGGSPERPFAFGLEQDTTASRGVARVGDSADAGKLSLVLTSPNVWALVYTPPGGLPRAPSTTVQLRAVIDQGSGIVRLSDG
ncbi:hypothetical protein [Sorangium sp. So ce1000]|uniref:hypothetical protein n=1 Tax=Sorangium sp. So ce1000 TaxID=3133325 RepID=UPI003F5D79A2